jgi:hypothetical protein
VQETRARGRRRAEVADLSIGACMQNEGEQEQKQDLKVVGERKAHLAASAARAAACCR